MGKSCLLNVVIRQIQNMQCDIKLMRDVREGLNGWQRMQGRKRKTDMIRKERTHGHKKDVFKQTKWRTLFQLRMVLHTRWCHGKSYERTFKDRSTDM